MQDKTPERSDSVQHPAGGFEPDAALTADTLFGLPCSRDEAKIVVLPVPWDATASYGKGAANGPDAIRRASLQLDFCDRLFGEPWRAGIYMEPVDEDLRRANARGRELSSPIIDRGGATADDAQAVAEVGAIGDEILEMTRSFASEAIERGRVPITLGGEHSVVEGAILGCAGSGAVGILQIDAHMDLREAYEGFRHSHASVMKNVLEADGAVSNLVQVGIRDWSPGEQTTAETDSRVEVFFDDDLDRLDWRRQCDRIVSALPERVYVSVDIDGLDPSLCPATGTPVPGGLGWQELGTLLHTLSVSGRRVVGADLVEVAPGPTEWDANVGARVLYRLCGLIANSNKLL